MKISQLCPTLCDPMVYSLPGSSVHGILQARILEWIAFSFPRYLPNPRTEPTSSALQADSLPSEPPGKPNSCSPLAKCSIFKHNAAAAAAAKSLQSCLTLCDPRDGNPSGSAVPGILQARTLERVAISFSDAGK